jgi:hypothetical protein
MNTQTFVQLPDITSENLRTAQDNIKEFANNRKLVIKGDLNLDDQDLTFNFPSKRQKKAFQRSLGYVISHPSMKTISLFLHRVGKYSSHKSVKLDYSEQEKAIQAARKEWKFLQKKAEEARLKYKSLKGDFYKS